MARAFLVGRILVGCFYLQNAFDHLANVGSMARTAAAHGVPAPELAIIGSGLLLLVAGLSFLVGAYPPLGVAAALAVQHRAPPAPARARAGLNFSASSAAGRMPGWLRSPGRASFLSC